MFARAPASRKGHVMSSPLLLELAERGRAFIEQPLRYGQIPLSNWHPRYILDVDQGRDMDELQQKEIVFERNEKSKGKAYLLWLLFGWLGVHRFYAGKTGSGLAQLLLSLSVIGLGATILWWLVDAFLIPGMINEHNLNTIDMIYGTESPKPAEEEAPRQLPNDTESRRQAMLDDLRQTGYRKERRDDITRLYR